MKKTIRLFPKQIDQNALYEIFRAKTGPYELIKAMYQNAVDAKATEAWVLLHHRGKGFVFFHNGTGLQGPQTPAYDPSATFVLENKVRTISEYEAFFSIGHMPNSGGLAQDRATKLCFECNTFTLITRCLGEPDWRMKTIHFPHYHLCPTFDITPEHTRRPWEILAKQTMSRRRAHSGHPAPPVS